MLLVSEIILWMFFKLWMISLLGLIYLVIALSKSLMVYFLMC
jgi:hypothetical protein